MNRVSRCKALPNCFGPIRCFSLSKCVKEAAAVLPTQPILENFVHHNPLKHFEGMEFAEAMSHVRKLEAYMSPGERALLLMKVDPRKRANEAMVELCSVFLDRGAAKWAPPNRDKGFLLFFARLEGLGLAPWRKSARGVAQRILHDAREGKFDRVRFAETLLEENLRFFGIPESEWASAVRAMALELRGWAGMFHRMEKHPEEAPATASVTLLEFCAVQSTLLRASTGLYAMRTGEWEPEATSFGDWLSQAPTLREQHRESSMHPSAIAFVDQSSERREGLELEFQQTLLHAVGSKASVQAASNNRPFLQLFTCIDDRECSFRRHIEATNPEVETFGVAGFFGVPVRMKYAEGPTQTILAPEGVKPKELLVEGEFKPDHEKTVLYNKRRERLAAATVAWEKCSFSPIGSLLLTAFVPFSLIRLFLMGFTPNLNRNLTKRLTDMILQKPRTDFALPFPPEHAAVLLARTFKDIGAQRQMAPIVLILGHASASVNNPFSAAYNCGACGGREGGTNARLFARLANDTRVRLHLQQDHGISVPQDTVFVGGLHNTTAETVEFYDVEAIPESHLAHFEKVKSYVEQTRGQNALERCKRFLLAPNVDTTKAALLYVQTRASDAAELRPELNHATNAAVVVGRRELTKGKFLDRRVFLPSYDPFGDDDAGTNLEHVLAPALIVCSGINLEYLFSTINVDHHGSGTKAPLNIVGNIGVLQGTNGDLRTGLPSQMTEFHTPIRAMYLVDAPVERVEAVLARRTDLRNLVRNEWVRLFVRDPVSGTFYRQSHGEYIVTEAAQVHNTFIPFTDHHMHGRSIARRENFVYWASTAGMVLSCAVPAFLFGPVAINNHGILISVCGTLLSLPTLAFARRYLHGEYMFGRFSFLCVGLVLGFNLVAVAPSLAFAFSGWSLFGFASVFLIGAYNERAVVRNNATFAFAAYQISDLALLTAAAFAPEFAASGVGVQFHPAVVAASLVVASLMKSSQFPLTSLFVRSMEGPTPASALGYAGLSAHVGVVLLASTMDLWFGFDWARGAVAGVGLLTALKASLVSRVRADRKGAIANATSATLGVIYCIIAMGYVEEALFLCFGHAAYRMIQILRAPNVISDTQKLHNALGHAPWGKQVSQRLYSIAWAFRRISSDFHLLNLLHWVSRPLMLKKPLSLSKWQQWCATALIVVFSGAPFTPFSHMLEEHVMELLHSNPVLATCLMATHFSVSVLLIRFLFLNVLKFQRFRIVNPNKKSVWYKLKNLF